MVGGGFLGRKCAGIKNEFVVGRHPVVPWWKCWIIIWMLWVMEVCVLFRQGFAEQQGVAGKPVRAPLSWQEEPSHALLKQGQTLTCWNLIWSIFLILRHLLCQERPLLKKEKIIFAVRVCVPEVLEEVGISDARLREGFTARVMLLPKWGCGSPQNWKQSASLNSLGEGEQPPQTPVLFLLLSFRTCQRTLKWPGF